MYIYIDILIITGIYINYFLLKATAKIMHCPLKNGRCIFAALIGSLFSLIILLPEISPTALILIRIAAAFITVVAAFYKTGAYELYISTLAFFFVSFIFAGIEYAVSLLGSGTFFWNNSMLYINISLPVLIISTIISYLALSLFRRFLDGSPAFDGKYTITIINGDKKIYVKAVTDTCNNLTDGFSGKPIIICGKNSLSELFDEKTLDGMLRYDVSGNPYLKGWRLIPFSTINSNGLLPSFLPGGIYIRNDENKKIISVSAYVGVVEKEMEYAVFNPKLIARA